jgi:hypothetical protein
MSGNYQKTPFFTSLARHGRREINTALELTGKALPASIVTMMGSIATIKFELTNIPFTLPNVTMPIAGSEYIRLPLQAGCKGVVFPADARLGAVSGLGGTSTDLSTPGNLSALVFFPLGNKGFAAPEDANQLELYGVDGALIKSTVNKEWFAQWTKNGVTIANKAGSASIAWNGTAWEIKGPTIFDGLVTMKGNLQIAGNMLAQDGSTYTGNIHTTGTITGDADVIAGTISGKSHVHTSGQPGTNTTAPHA